MLHVDGLLAQQLGYFLKWWTPCHPKTPTVHVAEDGVGVLVDGLALGLLIKEPEISRLRMVATSFSRLGICPMLAPRPQAPHMMGQPAAVHIVRLSQEIEQLRKAMAIKKLKLSSVSLIMRNSAVRRRPGCPAPARRRNDLPQLGNVEHGQPRPQEIKIDLAVLPETSCQGLFNQIHKKATKKCQEALSCS